MLIAMQVAMLERAAESGNIKLILDAAVAFEDMDTVLHIARNYNTQQHIADEEMRSALATLLRLATLHSASMQYAN